MSTANDTIIQHLEQTRSGLVKNRDVLDKSIRDIDAMMAHYSTATDAMYGGTERPSTVDVSNSSRMSNSSSKNMAMSLNGEARAS